MSEQKRKAGKAEQVSSSTAGQAEERHASVEEQDRKKRADEKGDEDVVGLTTEEIKRRKKRKRDWQRKQKRKDAGENEAAGQEAEGDGGDGGGPAEPDGSSNGDYCTADEDVRATSSTNFDPQATDASGEDEARALKSQWRESEVVSPSPTIDYAPAGLSTSPSASYSGGTANTEVADRDGAPALKLQEEEYNVKSPCREKCKAHSIGSSSCPDLKTPNESAHAESSGMAQARANSDAFHGASNANEAETAAESDIAHTQAICDLASVVDELRLAVRDMRSQQTPAQPVPHPTDPALLSAIAQLVATISNLSERLDQCHHHSMQGPEPGPQPTSKGLRHWSTTMSPGSLREAAAAERVARTNWLASIRVDTTGDRASFAGLPAAAGTHAGQVFYLAGPGDPSLEPPAATPNNAQRGGLADPEHSATHDSQATIESAAPPLEGSAEMREDANRHATDGHKQDEHQAEPITGLPAPEVSERALNPGSVAPPPENPDQADPLAKHKREAVDYIQAMVRRMTESGGSRVGSANAASDLGANRLYSQEEANGSGGKVESRKQNGHGGPLNEGTQARQSGEAEREPEAEEQEQQGRRREIQGDESSSMTNSASKE